MDALNDTIVAISTPLGKAGIGIVRLSGPKALSVADKIFFSKDKSKPSSFKTHTVHYGWIAEESKIIDEVLLTVMRAPKTYTRQDIVEVNCHSGIVVLRRILDLVSKKGCRLAEPGEFTKRAFLNGRIDLTQAEAVLDIINSQTEASLNAAMNQLHGWLSKEVSGIRDVLLDLLAQMEASIDFLQEDIQIITEQVIKTRLASCAAAIRKLLENIDAGIILRDGITVVISGRPNVGKSSLMNAFLERERVIVTPIAGTTRDSVEETVDINGIPVRLVDTAGMIKPKDLTEKMATAKAEEYLEAARLVLFVVDSSESLTKEDLLVAKKIKAKPCIVAANKIDLKKNIELDEIKNILGFDIKIVNVSATKNIGIDTLKKSISEFVWSGGVASPPDLLVTNVRHKIALEEAKEALGRSQAALDTGLSSEFVAVDVKDALNSLGKITGQAQDLEVLDRIFSRFCIGK